MPMRVHVWGVPGQDGGTVYTVVTDNRVVRVIRPFGNIWPAHWDARRAKIVTVIVTDWLQGYAA